MLRLCSFNSVLYLLLLSFITIMEGGIPLVNCLMQHSLRSLCIGGSDSSPRLSKWVYAVYWRIVPRNYPPPIWEHGGGGLLNHAKTNRRNWIIVWEDGFCDFCECLRDRSIYVKGRFCADVFFKLSHEVYSYGEGLVGKIAAENSHKWIFKDSPPTDHDQSSLPSSWNVQPIDLQPRAWEAQFNSGIETIAVISVRDGVVQLGSFEKIEEDLNLVHGIQRKFDYLHSIYSIERPRTPLHHPNSFEYHDVRVITGTNEAIYAADDGNKRPFICGKRKTENLLNDLWPAKSVYFGYNSPQNGFRGMFISPMCSYNPQSCYIAHEDIEHHSAWNYSSSKNGLELKKIDEVSVSVFEEEETIFLEHKPKSEDVFKDLRFV